MKKRVLACLAALTLAMSLLPVTALAEEGTTSGGGVTDPQVVSGVSKSKTATELNTSSWTSDITLSLPSAEEQLESDVVFVLDGSSSADTAVVKEALALLEELQGATGDNGAAVNVCVVKFKRQAYKSEWYDLATQYGEIKTAMESKYSGGTNIHAGLLAGQEALGEHKNISADKKYLILVSDGSTYLYSKDGNWASDMPFTRTYNTRENYTAFAGGFWDSYMYYPSGCDKNGNPTYEGNVPRPTTTSDVDAWQAYLKDVKARNETVNEAEGKTGDDYDYHCEYDNNFNKGIPSEDFKSQPCEPRTANNRDMAFYYADQTWQEMKAAGYQLYSIATKDGMAGPGNADDSLCFMNYLNGGAQLDFAAIKNEIIYAVSAGSQVTDVIGNAFSLDVGSFMLTVGGKAVDGTFDKDTNTWTFGAKEDGTPRFQVVYNSETKTFTWDIGENVTNFAHVQLHYTVKLDKHETAPGTYGVKDLDGDKYVDGTETPVDPDKALYTNESAVLVPVNSNNEQGAEEIFPQPTVSYEVKGGGGTIITPVKPDPKPDPEPPTDIDDPTTPSDPGSDIGEPETPTTPAEPPKTGDMMPLFAGMAAVSAAAITLLSRKRKEA